MGGGRERKIEQVRIIPEEGERDRGNERRKEINTN